MSKPEQHFPEHSAAPPRIEIVGENGIALRQLVAADVYDYFDLIDSNRAHLSKFYKLASLRYPNLQTVIESIEKPKIPGQLRFGIRSMGRMAGEISLTPRSEGNELAEISYFIGASYTGNGYAGEAASLLADYAFNTLGYKKLIAWADKANEASTKILMDLGFCQFDGFDGDDSICFELDSSLGEESAQPNGHYLLSEILLVEGCGE